MKETIKINDDYVLGKLENSICIDGRTQTHINLDEIEKIEVFTRDNEFHLILKNGEKYKNEIDFIGDANVEEIKRFFDGIPISIIE